MRGVWGWILAGAVLVVPLTLLAAAGDLRLALVAVAIAVGFALLMLLLTRGQLHGPPPEPRAAWTRERRLELFAKLAILVFVLGTFIWRARSASDLTETPVDAAGGLRIGADLLAAGLILAGTLQRPEGRRLLVPPSALFVIYIVTASFGIGTAVRPWFVVFRCFDLLVVAIVAIAASQWIAPGRLVAYLRLLLFGMTGLIVLSGAASPSLALTPSRGGIVPFRLSGVFPEFPDNSVGFIGLALFALSIAAPRFKKTGVVVGLTLVLLSQYRTGYVAVAVVILVYMIGTRGVLRKLGAVVAVPVIVLIYQSPDFQAVWTRGEQASDSVATLSGRTDLWSTALATAARSPIFGTGLTSGTRFEVLSDQLGLGDTSTIHGTWIEVYVGTGIVGTAVFSLFTIVALWAGWRFRSRQIAPLLFMVAVLVRSLSGTTYELASYTGLFFLMLAISAYSGSRASHATRVAEVRGERPVVRALIPLSQTS